MPCVIACECTCVCVNTGRGSVVGVCAYKMSLCLGVSDCFVDLVNFLNSLAKEMPFLLSSRDACGKQELSIGTRIKPRPPVT